MELKLDTEEQIPEGFKLTEVGAIPDDWEIQPASCVCQKIQDGTHFSPSIGGSEYRYVTSKNIRKGFILQDNVDWISKEEHDKIYRRCDTKKGDLLLTKDGASTGNAVINIFDDEISLLSSVAFLRFDERKFDTRYFLQQILSVDGQKQIEVAMSGNAITRLTLQKINNYKFAIPPTKAEQQAIAEALSDADELIRSLEKLIKKKRLIKQGAMQELLTGKRRLPGFFGEWNEFKIGEQVRFLKTGAYSRSQLNSEGNVKYLHYGDIHTSTSVFLSPDELKMPFLLDEFARNLDKLEKGDLIFADASEDIDGVGKSVEIKESFISCLVAGLHTIAARFDKEILADGFKAYLQFNPDFVKQLRRLAAGTKVYATTRSHIGSIAITLPGLVEQTAIATVLSDMDAEIAKFDTKLCKARQLKQGMMQELLTGKIRLV